MSPTTIFIIFCVTHALGVLTSVAMIGKPREPKTPREVCVYIIVAGLFFWGDYILWVN